MASEARKGMLLIGLFKLLKAVGLLLIGASLLSFLRHDPAGRLRHLFDFLHVDTHAHLVERLLAKIAGVHPRTLRRLGLGTLLYALVFGTEGVGLMLGAVWAEYMTTGVTVSFLPLEGYEVLAHPSVAKILVTVINAAVVVYLVSEIRRRRQAHAISLAGADNHTRAG